MFNVVPPAVVSTIGPEVYQFYSNLRSIGSPHIGMKMRHVRSVYLVVDRFYTNKIQTAILLNIVTSNHNIFKGSDRPIGPPSIYRYVTISTTEQRNNIAIG